MMSTTIPHTPGPWHHEADGHTGAVKTETKQLIASVFGGDPECHEDARQIANARLIAAAPDLLKALRAWVQSTSWDEQTGSMRPVYDLAKAAIARAEGR